jgi:hypothetical protein
LPTVRPRAPVERGGAGSRRGRASRVVRGHCHVRRSCGRRLAEFASHGVRRRLTRDAARSSTVRRAPRLGSVRQPHHSHNAHEEVVRVAETRLTRCALTGRARARRRRRPTSSALGGKPDASGEGNGPADATGSARRRVIAILREVPGSSAAPFSAATRTLHAGQRAQGARSEPPRQSRDRSPADVRGRRLHDLLGASARRRLVP